MGGKVLVPTREFVQKLQAARLAADLLDVPTVLVARTDANSAKLLTSDIDPRDRAFLTGARTPEGFFELQGRARCRDRRGLAYAPYADLLWCETSHADPRRGAAFRRCDPSRFPGKLLAYNCSPSFNWSATLDASTIGRFQDALGDDGLRVPVRHARRLPRAQPRMFELAREYRERGMTAYARLQDRSSRSRVPTATPR
jgi:isocitrate lyase